MKENKDHIKTNIKLEGLQKKQVFSVPDGYFTDLPSIIQSRAVKPKSTPTYIWSVAWRVALPVVALAMMLVYFGVRINNNDIDVQAMIDDISTEELVSYLTESDITTEELLSLIDINELDVDGIIDEDIKLLDDNEWDDLLNDYPEFENENEI